VSTENIKHFALRVKIFPRKIFAFRRGSAIVAHARNATTDFRVQRARTAEREGERSCGFGAKRRSDFRVCFQFSGKDFGGSFVREGVGPALDALRRDGLLGPKGGNLEGPANSEARRSPLNARTDPQTGLPQLHRFGTNREFQDSATPSRVNEQPWHRLAAYMILAKRTNSEIALVPSGPSSPGPPRM